MLKNNLRLCIHGEIYPKIVYFMVKYIHILYTYGKIYPQIVYFMKRLTSLECFFGKSVQIKVFCSDKLQIFV